MATRRAHHSRIATVLASRNDHELAALLSGGPATVEVDGVPVFAKCVPLTDLELAHPQSTANLFDLPTFCQYFFGMPNFVQYGFGGPALNGWRELAANLIITDGVLSGESESFPLLYHWRVLPVRPSITAEQHDVDAVVAALDDSATVRERLEALRVASHSLVLFSEYIPYRLPDWLQEDPAGKAETVERQILEIAAFLRRHRLLHMDGNFSNMRSDGERVHFIDFGLATSVRFDLSAAEGNFVERHTTYDADYAAMRLVHWQATATCGVPLPDAKIPNTRHARDEFVRQCADGHIPDGLPPAVAGILSRHAPTAARMNRFYRRLFDGDLHTTFA